MKTKSNRFAKKIGLALLPVFLASLLCGVGMTTQTAFADQQVYDVEKEFPGATGEYTAVSGSGGPQWYYQALDVVAFYAYGTGESNVETGALTTNVSNTTLQLYPLVRDGNQGNGTSTEMKDGSGEKNIDALVQYPAGNGVAYSDADIGTQYYTSSQQYLKMWGGQAVHPGKNLAVVYSFKVPRSGSVYLKDDIRVVAGGNGVRLSVYHQPQENSALGYGVWGGSTALSLYGAKPIYPTPQTHINASGAGWQFIPADSTFRFITDNIDVREGDVLHFILEGNEDISNDKTFFAPKVVYGQRPDEIVLNTSEVSLAAPADVSLAGETYQLSASIFPNASAGKTVTYSSNNSDVATVSASGLITAVAAGDAIITATLVDGVGENEGAVTAECRVTVVPPEVTVSINEEGEDLVLEQAHSIQLTYTILPVSSMDKTVIWTIESETPEIAGEQVIEVSATGLVTAKQVGEATVRASVEGTEAFSECVITVTAAPNPVLRVDKTTVNAVAGETVTLSTGITPLYHENDIVTVISSDEATATAEWEEGEVTVTAKKAGVAILTLGVAGGNSVEVTVNVVAEAERVYSWRNEFATNQGSEWYYYFLKEGESDYTELCYATSEWGAYEENLDAITQKGGWKPKPADLVGEADAIDGVHNQYLLLWQGHFIHPGSHYAAVLGFRAPLTGTLDFISYFRMYDSRSDGVQVRVLKGSEQIFPAQGKQTVGVDEPVEVALQGIEVTAGEMFYLIVDCNESNAFDKCYVAPEFRYTEYERVPDSLQMNQTSVSVSVGKDVLLSVTVTPAESASKKITWSSSDETVATVDEHGIVTALKEGTAVITAQLPEGAQAECTVTVTPSEGEGTPPPDGEEPTADGCRSSFTDGFGIGAILCTAALAVVVFQGKMKKGRK